MEDTQRLHWIWLSLALGSENRCAATLIETFGDASAVYRADEDGLSCITDLSTRTHCALLDKSLDMAISVLDLCEQDGIGILTYADKGFPDVLRTIKAPPVLLYYRGRLPDLNRRFCAAMVGTRDMSEYGMHCAYKISYELATANALVVSGMARGIDSVCAAAALAAGGETVAILAGGVNAVYPKRHSALYEEICAHGAVMSEYPPSAPSLKHRFPERNRLISGMCRATLVIEGNARSGALITAREALSENRAVYALPADIGRAVAEGTNALLEEGAKPLLCTRDVLKRFESSYVNLAIKELETLSPEKTKTDLAYLTQLGVLKSAQKQARTRSDAKKETPCDKTAVSPKEVKTADAQAAPLSKALLSSLPPVQAQILLCIEKAGDAVSADALYALPFAYGEISAAMTQMEIRHLIKRLPGSMIGRC